MRFIETDSKDYIAVDTIAKITDVVIHYRDYPSTPQHPRPRTEPSTVTFKVITKRGEKYDVEMGASNFYRLVKGE